ncbi:MAG: patatin-like phospholipase family protein [Bdellovibrionaceae bacterium]|nr:patatin-like phospholipase family protein [Pseudobdellovibrionaceae bacterium]
MDIQGKKKLGLVLSGGGIKAAAFHIGVCLALKEKGFQFAGGTKEVVRQKYPDGSPLTFRVYVGSSAGAFLSAILAGGYEPESLINAFQLGSGETPTYDKSDLRFLKPIRYSNIFAVNGRRILSLLPDALRRRSLVAGGLEAIVKNGFKLNGLFTTKGLERYLRKEALIDNEFSRLGVELYVVATQLNHTRKAIFGPFAESSKTTSTKFINYSSISDAVACSTALPPVFAPYGVKTPEDKELFYYDGEIRETLSAHVAADHGCDLVISSYSVQPYHYTPEIGSLHTYGVPVIINQALYQVIEQKISKHIEWNSNLKQLYKALDRHFRDQNIDESQREKVLEIVRQKLNFRPDVDYIHIHPRPQDYEMFFVDHFSLNPKILERIVRIGFKSTLNVLRRYDI